MKKVIRILILILILIFILQVPAFAEEKYIYRAPNNGEGNDLDTTQDGLDKIISDSESFIDSGAKNQILDTKLQENMGYIYNIFLQIGVGIAVIVGLVLGVKFILAGIDEKAEVKKMLTVYVIACIVVFGSFGIWKITMNILGNL